VHRYARVRVVFRTISRRRAAMTQRIVVDYPPNFAEIDAVFHVATRRGVIFSFGPVIYNPSGVGIGGQFLAHERVHGERQGTSEAAVLEWWKRYCDDAKFRLAEELPAHQAEYRYLLERGNRNQRRAAANDVAARLASPMYGRMVGRATALQMLRSAIA
jgi:hypothetical protein